MKQRQKPIISVDINVIKLVRKSICAILVSLKENLGHVNVKFTSVKFISVKLGQIEK